MSESVDELVRDDADLTAYAGIGEAIASAIREIVLTGTLGKLEKLRSAASPELASISAFPRLDPKRVLRIYKKLDIRSRGRTSRETRKRRDRKTPGTAHGSTCAAGHYRAARHAAVPGRTTFALPLKKFLLEKCGVRRAEAVGDYRRRVDVIEELAFIVETDDFAAVVSRLERYGGRTPLLSATPDSRILCALLRRNLARSTRPHRRIGGWRSCFAPAAKLTCANWPPLQAV